MALFKRNKDGGDDRGRDRQPEEEQPKRPYQQDHDYSKLRRFQMDFGREHNITNHWGIYAGKAKQ
jgi:hypothetical protein